MRRHTSWIPSIMLVIRGIILLLLVMLYPRKYLIWERPITMAEAVVNPEITEWLMNRINHPNLLRNRGKISK